MVAQSGVVSLETAVTTVDTKAKLFGPWMVDDLRQRRNTTSYRPGSNRNNLAITVEGSRSQGLELVIKTNIDRAKQHTSILIVEQYDGSKRLMTTSNWALNLSQQLQEVGQSLYVVGNEVGLGNSVSLSASPSP
ncbi:hypothetical protein V6N12_062708 [Hibiscus sabdariffa]|uniref:Uncharacterized protein n=1 Tax=Hibiscus sabdariffa TaxID=183260 RepID=A0ABR2F9N6_9ROSI